MESVGRCYCLLTATLAALARQHALPVLSNDAHFDAVDGIQRIPF